MAPASTATLSQKIINLLRYAIPGISSLSQHGYMNQLSTPESAKFEFKFEF